MRTHPEDMHDAGAARPASRWIAVTALALALATGACAGKRAVLEMSGAVLYDKPKIERAVHSVDDRRSQSGGVILKVEMWGDPGLAATFDLLPDVALRRPMREIEPGRYAGDLTFPETSLGGPYTVVVRLFHEAAGEATWRDPEVITIPLFDEEP